MVVSERSAMIRRLKSFHRRYTRHVEQVRADEDERSRLYLEARATNPPITYREIAEVFGVTEAAVMQKVKRHDDKVNGRPPAKPRQHAG